MLRFLGVRHLAVIDTLEVEFEPGLNVLSGETGAGKSVLVLAIDLLAGGRASADLVRTGEDAASIQAIFERARGEDVIVRREISAQGRSRAFIDDTLATTAALKERGADLIELHGQHEHQSLLNPAEHAALIDGFAEHGGLVDAAGAGYDAWRAAAGALDRTALSDQEKKGRLEIATFHLQEIDRVAPRPAEDDTLTAERTVLANADRLTRLSHEAYGALYDGESAALASLATVWRRVGELAEFDPRFRPYLEARDAVKAPLDDLAHVLRSYASNLDSSPERLQAVEDRLAQLDRLKKKHGPALPDVLARRQALVDEIAGLAMSDEQTAELRAKVERAAKTYLEAARDLHRARTTAATHLARRLENMLGDLAMPECRVKFIVHDHSGDQSRWGRDGSDQVEFLLSPNPGEELRPLERIASGGELSRVMLAIRTLAASDHDRRTLVFDEVDAGIGGAAADAVGALLQNLGRRHQVLCITHLPQIAARAAVHIQLTKSTKAGRTRTVATRLDESGRELEIARMIAGAAISPQVLASARELLLGRRESEAKTKGESETRTPAKAKGRKS